MKLLKKLSLITLFLSTNATFAGNIYGSDIFWKRLSNDTFQIRFEIYNDCAEPLDSIYPEIIPFQCTPTLSVKFGKYVSHITQNVTPRCYKDHSKCETNPTLPYGIDENIFIYTIYLGDNPNCCWYKILLKGLNRDDQISNGNANTAFETSASFDRCVSSNIESPEFKNRAVGIKYKDNDAALNHGVVQLSGDSISYAMKTPVNCVFNAPYSATYPFTCYGGNIQPTTISPYKGFGLESLSGEITCHPMVNGYFIFRMEAQQWKKLNGVYTLVGISNRELMFLVIDKPITYPPTLSGPYSYTCHAGQLVCITVNSNDPDADDTTRLYWDKKLPWATFSDNNGQAKHASATLCWTPSDDDASCLPYYFNVTAYDDNCMLEEYCTKQYNILVMPTMLSKQKLTRINCHTYQFKNLPTNRSGCLANIPYTTKWYEPKLVGMGSPLALIGTQDSIRYDFKTGGQYIIKHTFYADGISNVYFDTIMVDTFAAVNVINTDSTINANDTVLLFATTNAGTKNNRYQWWGNGKLLDTSVSVSVHPAVTTTYTLINKALVAPCDITEDNITLTVNGTVGINLQNISQILVLTNPFENEIALSDYAEEFILYSMDGKVIVQNKPKKEFNKIDPGYIASGLYFLVLRKSDEQCGMKIIKK